jgi:WD40 repeat protein
MSGHVFISYSHKDRDYVEELARVLARAEIPVWFDYEIESGSRFTRVIQQQIDECAAFVVVMTPTASDSEWVEREVKWALDIGKPVMPILLDARPFFAVGHLDYLDSRTGAMPDEKWLVTVKKHLDNYKDTDEGELLQEMRAHDGHVRSVAYPAGNPSLVGSAGPEPVVRVWDPTTGQLRLALPDTTWPVAFSYDGSVIATGGLDYSVHLWDTTTGTFMGRIGQHQNILISVAISKDGRLVVTGSKDGSERVWDARTGDLLQTFAGKVDPGSPLVFAPDGTWVIAPNAGNAGTASQWDVRTGTLIKIFKGHTGPVHDVTVSFDGKYVATGGDDRSARIWDAQTGRELHKLNLHTLPVRSVAFSPNGLRLATGSTDKSIRLWDATTGAPIKKIARIARNAGGIYDLAYSPDGKTLASGHGDGAIRIWSG